MSDAVMTESIPRMGRSDARHALQPAGHGVAMDDGRPGLGAPTDDDYRLLEEHGGVAALERAGLHVVADRLSFCGYPANSNQVVKKDGGDV